MHRELETFAVCYSNLPLVCVDLRRAAAVSAHEQLENTSTLVSPLHAVPVPTGAQRKPLSLVGTRSKSCLTTSRLCPAVALQLWA